MSASSTAAHPIQTLREHATALEAAVAVCMGKPKVKNVHRLRTMSRRVEAQLILLDLLDGVPRHRQESVRLARIAKRLRRAAGEVRDRDVHIGMVDEAAASSRSPVLRNDAAKLRDRLVDEREDAAKQLLRFLGRREGKVANTIESLMDALEPAETLELPAGRLIALIDEWFRKTTSGHTHSDPKDADLLHAIRKSAKLARYMAENAPPEAKSAHNQAAQFE